MKTLLRRAVGCAIAMAAGNFVTQLATNHRWGHALELSFFQAVAIAALVAALTPWIRKLESQDKE